MMSGALARREPCVACGQPVFLAQRLLVDRRLYHRTCFRCARCGAQLTLSGCYQTETDGQYCCETCPDEEEDSFTTIEDNNTNMDNNSSINQFDEIKSNKTLSDEEKFNLKLQEETEKKINANFDSKINPKWESSVAFTGFVSNYLHQKDSDDDDVLPALPTSLPPDKSVISRESSNVEDIDLKLSGKPSSSDERPSVKSEENLPVTKNNALSESLDDNKLFVSDNSVNICEKKVSVLVDDEKLSNHDNDKSVSEEIDVNISSDQLATASSPAELTKDEEIIDDFAKDGAETIPEDFNKTKEAFENSEISLVKARMKIFEANNKISIDKTQFNKINFNNRKPDQDVNIDERISDPRTEENNDSNVTIESNSLGDIEILKNSSDMKSDEYNIEVPCSDIVSNVPLNEGENLQSTDKLNDTELIPDAVSEISLINNVDIQPDDVSQDNENLKSNENEEIEKKIEDLDDVVQEKESLNSVESDIVINIIQPESDQNLTLSENVPIENLVTEEPKHEKEEDKKNENYPEHLNPFSDDEGDDENKSENSKNPFDCSSDENENVAIVGKPKAAVRKKNNVKPPRPPPPVFTQNSNKTNTARRVIAAPFVSLNPFSSDEDGNSEDENTSVRTPIPTPRQSLKGTQESNSSSSSFLGVEPRSFHGSSSSLSSTVSRKKKGQAPKPPSVDGSITKKDGSYEHTDDTKNTVAKSLFPTRDNGSISPRSRKRRPAPLPPPNVQTSLNLTESLSYEQNLNLFDQQLISNNMYCSTPILKTDKSDNSLITSKKIISAADFDNDPDFSVTNVWEKKVSEKEEKNIELNMEKEEEIMPLHHNKSTSGQWKRRKGPAPAIPLLQRRISGPPMPPAVLRRELQMLEAQQRGLEKQGVRLEELIRDRCENNTSVEVTSAEPDPETDELVLQLFELVNEKNELFRRQSELMYIRRQQRLEEEHADLEHQIRILMARPEANKTDSDKAKEEQLIQRLVEVVERRNEVITSLEMDRLREKEEDKTIRERMASHRAKRDENSSISSLESHNKDTLKLEKKKTKKIWLKKGKTKKNDSNNGSLDERPEQTVQKEKKHKKWFSP